MLQRIREGKRERGADCHREGLVVEGGGELQGKGGKHWTQQLSSLFLNSAIDGALTTSAGS